MGWIVVRPNSDDAKTLVIHGGRIKTCVAVARAAMDSCLLPSYVHTAVNWPRVASTLRTQGKDSEASIFSSAYDHSGISESWGHWSVITGPDYPHTE
jgi:hypothetical protein